MKAKFITFEGIEGAGKTTQLNLTKHYLQKAGYPLIVTREPGGTPLGEEIRSLVLAHRREDMMVDTELLLMFAARAEHVHKIVVPALKRGYWVLCDRFTDATYAYQGGGRNTPLERIAVLEDWVQETLRPDLTLLFDLPVEKGLARAGKRGQADRFESEDSTFFQRVRHTYLDLATRYPERYRVIDADRSVEAIRADVERTVKSLLE